MFKRVLVLLVTFLFLPGIVRAADYDITNFAVEAYIKNNGDVEVNEIIVLDGTFNGYERDLSYKANLNDKYESSTFYQGSKITDISVKAKYISKYEESLFDDTSFTKFNKVSYASNGDVAKYIESALSDGYRERMYYKASSQKVAFYLSYTIKDLVVKHDDVAELYFPFIGDGFEDDIRNIDIKVYLPNSDTSLYHRVWAHGVLTGEVEKIDNTGLHAYASKVDAGEVLDVRMTFDTSLVPYALKETNTKYFDKILEVEEKRAEDANSLRESLKRKYNFIKYGTILYYIALILLTIFIYYKYGKSPKSGYYSKYNREFIDDYNVEVIDYLMNKKITPNAMSASIMNLIYKKNIKPEEIVDAKGKKDYLFTLLTKDGVNDSEDMLIDFLFLKVGKDTKNSENKNTFTTKNLKDYAKSSKTCNKFLTSYTKWKNDILAKGKKEKFFVKSAVPVIIGIVMFIIGMWLIILASGYGVDYIPTYVMALFMVMFVIYACIVDKKTLKGSEHYDKWKAFKNFLDDFGAFELKELPEVVLWERYLVYATIFGLADKVQKSMNVKIKEFDTSEYQYDYYPSFFYINLGNTISSSINNAVSSAQAATLANSSSSASSGGGFGGGFSGGSGFSGGGGGRGF